MFWVGKYDVDRTQGHGDQICMRVNAGAIKSRCDRQKGDERPNILLGSSFWSGPYLVPRYRFGMWVKADQFKGKVALIANCIGSEADPTGPRAELPIDGRCDWTHVSFEADFPRRSSSWVLRIDPVGEGVIWVDDVEVTPLTGI